MYLPARFRRLTRLIAIAVLAMGAGGAVQADPADHTNGYDWRAMIPDGCIPGEYPGEYDRSSSHTDTLQAYAAELGLTGQQQQDLQILTADYAERLRDLAKLMGEFAKQLMASEPGDPDYWPLAQQVSASAASSSAETVILLSEMREKFYMVLTDGQRAELKRQLEEHKQRCKPQGDTEQVPE